LPILQQLQSQIDQAKHKFGGEENTEMSTLFGMAGLAEAAELYSLMIGYAGLLLLGLMAAAGLFTRSRVASGITLALAFLLTLMFTPWEAFKPLESGDPDVHDWVAAWRSFGWWWGFTVAASMVASIPAFCLSDKAAMQQGQQPIEQGAQADRPSN
jgi:hypothetical protein